MALSSSKQVPRDATPGAAVALLVLLPAIYVSTYFALSNPGIINCERFPRYLLEGDWVHTIFHPLERLDRYVRPEYWQWEEEALLGVTQ